MQITYLGVPGGSVGKESACQSGTPGFDAWVGQDPLAEGTETQSSLLAWRIPVGRGAWRAAAHGLQSRTRPSDSAQPPRPRARLWVPAACAWRWRPRPGEGGIAMQTPGSHGLSPLLPQNRLLSARRLRPEQAGPSALHLPPAGAADCPGRTRDRQRGRPRRGGHRPLQTRLLGHPPRQEAPGLVGLQGKGLDARGAAAVRGQIWL